jgi:hypothetical protein
MLVAGALVAVMALAGCSGPAPESANDPATGTPRLATSAPQSPDTADAGQPADSVVGELDVCELYPVGDLVAETGRDYTRFEGASDDSGIVPLTACSYAGASDDIAELMVFTIYVYPRGGADAFADYNDRVGGATAPTPVEGIGDEAQQAGSDLVVRYGDTVIAVIDTAYPQGIAELTPEQFAAVAETVHDRM